MGYMVVAGMAGQLNLRLIPCIQRNLLRLPTRHMKVKHLVIRYHIISGTAPEWQYEVSLAYHTAIG